MKSTEIAELSKALAKAPRQGKYITPHGSKVEISGKYAGIITIDFDWFEEPKACIECQPDADIDFYEDKPVLNWHCEECGGGRAELTKVAVGQ